ncbi:MAG: long-chain-fatty-acid--CoA ligase [Deltaproteobacteria bacterium]|nr:long-chain-fatty-acid--CoA ligase [Deltaproteobacteria bacterium]
MYVLGDVPKKGATLNPDKTAIVFENRRITFKELDERVNRLANAFIGLGCKKGDRLAILSENTHKYMEVYFAAAKAGMSVTPLNFRLSDTELAYIVNDSESVLFLAGDGYEGRSKTIKSQLKHINNYISLDNHAESHLFYEDILRESSVDEPKVPVNENDMAILMYTGGTTGLPKGVMLSHRNILSAMYGLIISFTITRHDTECFILPLFHISLWPVLCVLMVGGTAVIIRRPDLQTLLQAIQKEKCTHIVLVPTLLNWILDLSNIDEFDLTSLRLITYAGSPMPAEILKKCISKFGNIFAQGYGLTEAAPLVTTLHSEDHFFDGPKAKLLMSVGKEGATVNVRVVDENDQPVNPGQVGEIVARGENIMMGYWKNPDLTTQALRGGWLHTGDLGTLDEEGYIYLVDRKADMIVTGGENVYPKETEDILYSHPAVFECAVVSAPDAKWGERVQAVVVLKNGCHVTEEEMITYCKQRLAGYKCPKKIDFWDDLPKTTVGKIKRKDVKKHFWEGCKKMVG